MEKEAQTIEVEVVEIDGIAQVPAASIPREPSRGSSFNWQKWVGRISRLDARWWPLWVLLGTVAVVFALTIGLVAAILAAKWPLV